VHTLSVDLSILEKITLPTGLKFVECQFDAHASAIQDIFNYAILNTTALYEYEPRSMPVIQRWFETKQEQGWPVLGLVNEQGQLLGFASYGTFRAFPAFQYTVEHSIYVHPEQTRKGYGRYLLQAIIQLAKKQQLHVIVGGIDADNKGSIALHEQLGFEHSGTIRQAGYKFERWLDLAFYQLIL
jgi:phosphinothricin acetyltransferase